MSHNKRFIIKYKQCNILKIPTLWKQKITEIKPQKFKFTSNLFRSFIFCLTNTSNQLLFGKNLTFDTL